MAAAEEDVSMQVDANTIDTSNMGQLLALCFKCATFQMASQFNISLNWSNHECTHVYNPNIAKQNLAKCLHMIIDAAVNCHHDVDDLNLSTINLPSSSSSPSPSPSPLPPPYMLLLSTIRSKNHGIKKNSLRRMITSTPIPEKINV